MLSARAKEETGKMRIGLRAVQVDEKGAVRVDGREESGRTARELEADSAEERASQIHLLPLQSSTRSIFLLSVAESGSEEEDDVKPATAARDIAPPGSDDVTLFLQSLRVVLTRSDAGII